MKNVVRLLIVAILVVAAVIAVYTNRQTSAAKTAYDQLEAALDRTDSSSLTDLEVHERIGRKPDTVCQPSKNEKIETYVWSSLVRSNTVTVYYTVAATTLMEKVALE